MNKTQIEWVKNPDGTQGYTWNPITGCLNGCEYCYARKLANGRLRSLYLANENLAGGYRLARGILKEGAILPKFDPFYPRFWPEKLREPYNKTTRWGSCRRYTQSSKGIFVCDMSDLFGIGISEEWTQRVLNTVRDCPQHRFYLLTKQPQNLIKFSPFPDNCWVGVTVCNADMLFDAINCLDDIQCSLRYLSIEPMLASCHLEDLTAHLGSSVDWVIIGAQTKPYKPPKIEWVQEIVGACDKAGIPVFLKNKLIPLLRDNLASWKRDPHYLLGGILRQEMPANKLSENQGVVYLVSGRGGD